jgi:hypothetical protein
MSTTNKKRSFGEWLSDVGAGVVQGAFWLFETIPLTAVIVLPLGIVHVILDLKRGQQSDWFNWLAVIMLIDGYFGHRRAERNEQEMMDRFHRWHAEEMAKAKEDKV